MYVQYEEVGPQGFYNARPVMMEAQRQPLTYSEQTKPFSAHRPQQKHYPILGGDKNQRKI